MKSALVASLCRGISPLSSAAYCSAFGSAGDNAYVQFPVIFKNGANIRLGRGAQIGYGTRMLLAREQQLHIGENTIVESFAAFEPGLSITIGRGCRILRGTRVPAGTNLADGTVLGRSSAEVPQPVRANGRDFAATALFIITLVLFCTPQNWAGWFTLGAAAVVSSDDAVFPFLSLAMLLAYLANVGWGQEHTVAADNFVLCLLVSMLITALRACVKAVQGRPQRLRHPERTA